MKIKTTIANVHHNTKMPTLSLGSLQQHYVIRRLSPKSVNYIKILNKTKGKTDQLISYLHSMRVHLHPRIPYTSPLYLLSNLHWHLLRTMKIPPKKRLHRGNEDIRAHSYPSCLQINQWCTPNKTKTLTLRPFSYQHIPQICLSPNSHTRILQKQAQGEDIHITHIQIVLPEWISL